MTKRQEVLFNLISEELGNVMGDFLYKEITNGVKGRDLDKVNKELDADLKVALIEFTKGL